MATAEEIAAVLTDVSRVTARTYAIPDIKALAATYTKDFGATPYREFTDSVDEWLDGFSEKPPQSMPTPAMIWAIVLRNRKGRAERSSVAPSIAYTPPRREFVEAMLEAWKIAGIQNPTKTAVGGSMDRIKGRHDHEQRHRETGVWGRYLFDGEWRPCAKCVAARERQLERAVLLAEHMPTPREELTACPDGGKCDGTGWVNTLVTRSIIAGETSEGDRKAYPCEACNAELFGYEIKGLARS